MDFARRVWGIPDSGYRRRAEGRTAPLPQPIWSCSGNRWTELWGRGKSCIVRPLCRRNNPDVTALFWPPSWFWVKRKSPGNEKSRCRGKSVLAAIIYWINLFVFSITSASNSRFFIVSGVSIEWFASSYTCIWIPKIPDNHRYPDFDYFQMPET